MGVWGMITGKDQRQYLFLEQNPNSGVYNCRGQVTQRDDVGSFARKMKVRGLTVLVSFTPPGRMKDLVLDEITKPTVIEG